jgi:molecular chaperone GrpE
MATKNQNETGAAEETRSGASGADGATNMNDQAFDEAVSDSEQLAQELATANDRALRLQAEMQNLRNRTSREIADERRYAALPVLRDLLPVLDNIGRAIEAAEKAGEAENLLAGFRLVRQQLETILSRYEAQPINPQGEPFDPHFHEAILQQPSVDVPADHVTMVTQTGYKLHDRVVRPAQVIVSSGPAAG